MSQKMIGVSIVKIGNRCMGCLDVEKRKNPQKIN